MNTFFQLIKLRHWIKNLFIFAPIIFSQSLLNYKQLSKAIIAFFSFSFITVFVYIINDIKDINQDKMHEIKSKRPIASGKISTFQALIVAFLFCISGLILSIYLLGLPSFFIIFVYLIMNLFYTFFLKQILILDVILISIGFCLRVLLGSTVINVILSHWMLLGTFSVSLLIGFGKRRHELNLLGNKAHLHRNILSAYTKELLDMMIIVSTAISAISYALYTMTPQIITKFNTDKLIFTVPFVIYGLFRYLFLIYCKNEGGSPEELVTRDLGIIITIILYLAFVLFLIYFKNYIKLNFSFIKIFLY